MNKRIDALKNSGRYLTVDQLDEQDKPKSIVKVHLEGGSDAIEYWLLYQNDIDVEHTDNGVWFFVNGFLIESSAAIDAHVLEARFHCKTEAIWIGEDSFQD